MTVGSVKIEIRRVDDSWSEWEDDRKILDRLARLHAEGYSGKHLINELLTDDWAAPPLHVFLTGVDASGQPFKVTLEYD